MISFQNFSFRYEESKDFTLRGIDMTVQTGEFILLTGRSGCGKTTLIRSLNGLIPHFYPGEIQGDLLMDGHSLLEMKPSELAGQVGTVFQDPRSQFFMTDTTRELAFGCENLGLSREETIDRITKAAKELVPQKKYKEDPNDAGDGVVRIGVAPLALIHVMEAARGAVRRLHAVFVHHAVTRCKIAAAFARKLFFCFLQFLYGIFGVLCYTENGKNP